MGGAEYGREHLLGRRPVCAAVATADFAHHDGRANRVLGSPVGRIDARVAEEGEEGRRFGGQMGSKALDGGNGRSRGGEEVQYLFEQAAARACEPVRGDLAGRVAIAQRERLLEPLLDARGKRAA